MRGSVLIYDSIPYHWRLSKGAEHDCVPLSLAEALGGDADVFKERLAARAVSLDQPFR